MERASAGSGETPGARLSGGGAWSFAEGSAGAARKVLSPGGGSRSRKRSGGRCGTETERNRSGSVCGWRCKRERPEHGCRREERARQRCGGSGWLAAKAETGWIGTRGSRSAFGVELPVGAERIPAGAPKATRGLSGAEPGAERRWQCDGWVALRVSLRVSGVPERAERAMGLTSHQPEEEC